jgi:hypothetical protein
VINNVILISEKDIKNESLIQLNVEPKVISRTVLDCQTIYLRPILGDTLYEQVLTEVINKSTVPGYVISDAIKTLLEQYIQPYLCSLVESQIVVNLSFKMTNKGVLKYNDASANNISSEELEYFKNYLDARVSGYKAILIDYLTKNNLTSNISTDRDITSDGIGWYLPEKYYGQNTFWYYNDYLKENNY